MSIDTSSERGIANSIVGQTRILRLILSNRSKARRSTKEFGQSAQVPGKMPAPIDRKPLSQLNHNLQLGIFELQLHAPHKSNAGVPQAQPFQLRQPAQHHQPGRGDFGFRKVQLA